jgi:mRNA interferase YafQ
VRFSIRRTTQFKKDVKQLLRSGKNLENLLGIVQELAEGRQLTPQHKDHPLRGKYLGKRDCHIEPDWILIYAIEDNDLVLYRTGSHANLFC